MSDFKWTDNHRTCPDCHGNLGWYNGSDGNTYLSDPDDYRIVIQWQRCDTCDGSGFVPKETNGS